MMFLLHLRRVPLSLRAGVGGPLFRFCSFFEKFSTRASANEKIPAYDAIQLDVLPAKWRSGFEGVKSSEELGTLGAKRIGRNIPQRNDGFVCNLLLNSSEQFDVFHESSLTFASQVFNSQGVLA